MIIGLADVRGRGLVLRPHGGAHPGALRHLARPVPRRRAAAGYQLSQSLFAQADGGLFGRGLGDSLVQLPGATNCHDFPDCGAILPAPHTDFIYAVIVDELGLFGGAAVVLIYALIAERGFKTAILAEDGFSKLLATGLTAIFALQAFVIIGGVTRVIPLTGVTLPFISYGGQLDRRQLHPARPAADDLRQGATQGAAPERGEDRLMNRQIVKLFGFVLVLYALLFGFTSYWSVFDAELAEGEPGQPPAAARGAEDQARRHPRRRRHR